MAFYGFKGDADNCYWTPYYSTPGFYYNYDSTPTPTLFPVSDEFGESDSNYCYEDYSFTSLSESNYSLHTFSEPNYPQNYYQELSYNNPKFLQYEAPISDPICYLPVERTNFTISYSVSEFNEPEFERYDPTPYSGGYDPAVTYGKPLPPSDIICYPRTLPKSGGATLDDFSYNSIPSPYGKEEDDAPKKPPKGSKPVNDVSKKPPNGSKPEDDGPKKPQNGSKPADAKTDKEAPVVGADVIPSGEPSDDPGEDCNGVGGDYGDEYQRRFDRIPYGSGLESLDLCDSIFGYWPCLAKIEQQQQRAKCLEACDHHGRMDPWQSAADYLFGTPAMYGYGNYQQAHQGYENSWL